MKAMLLSATLMSALILTGCGTPDRYEHSHSDRHDAREHRHHDKEGHRQTHKPSDQLPHVANADQVRNCQFLSEVNTSWGQTARHGMTGSEAAMRELRMRANGMGATHIVMAPSRAMAGDTHERARAYRCEKR